MSRDSRRVAHFLLTADLAGSPPNHALLEAYAGLGFVVDLYAPSGSDSSAEAPGANLGGVEYGKRWIALNAWRPGWRRYSLVSATSEDPLGVAGAISFLHGIPMVALADEIKSGSYRGDASEGWKRLCRWTLRHSRLCIVNDPARVELLRSYACLGPRAKVVVYPGGYRNPSAPGNRTAVRASWGFAADDFVLGFSGYCGLESGLDWVLAAVRSLPWLKASFQPLGMDPTARHLLEHVAGRDRIYLQGRRLGWHEAWAEAVAFDVGIAIYRQTGPQFQLMGVSSNRLCMFLAMGVPVIASRQESFSFLEQYDCGILVSNGEELAAAVAAIRERAAEMRANALRCWREYVDPEGRYRGLVEAITRVVERSL